MSYSLTTYAIDLEELRSAVGGKDEALLAALRSAKPEVFAESLQDQGDDEGELSDARALTDLVMGNPYLEGSAHQYGYALKHLCEHLGEWLPSDYWDSVTWRVLQGTGMDELLGNSGSPVPLPPIADFPTIGHLTADRVRNLASRLGEGPPKTVDLTGKRKRRSLQQWLVDKVIEKITRRSMPGEDDLCECMEEYAGWLRTAASKGKALVFFYH